MVDIDMLFRGKSEASTHCYLKWDRASALADFMVRRAGSFEVPISAPEPKVEYFPDTTPRFPRSHDRYYTDGGLCWPERYVISAGI